MYFATVLVVDEAPKRHWQCAVRYAGTGTQDAVMQCHRDWPALAACRIQADKSFSGSEPQCQCQWFESILKVLVQYTTTSTSESGSLSSSTVVVDYMLFRYL
jgi:hypothetical protein